MIPAPLKAILTQMIEDVRPWVEQPEKSPSAEISGHPLPERAEGETAGEPSEWAWASAARTILKWTTSTTLERRVALALDAARAEGRAEERKRWPVGALDSPTTVDVRCPKCGLPHFEGDCVTSAPSPASPADRGKEIAEKMVSLYEDREIKIHARNTPLLISLASIMDAKRCVEIIQETFAAAINTELAKAARTVTEEEAYTAFVKWWPQSQCPEHGFISANKAFLAGISFFSTPSASGEGAR